MLEQAITAQGGAGIVDKIMMRTHFAVFTETDMLAYGPQHLPAQPVHTDADMVLPARPVTGFAVAAAIRACATSRWT